MRSYLRRFLLRRNDNIVVNSYFKKSYNLKINNNAPAIIRNNQYFFRDFKSSLFVDFKIIPKTIGITAVNRPNIFNVYLSKFSNSSFLVFFFSKVKTNEGNTTKFANIAKAKVQEINPPSAIVPLKLDNVKVAKPRIKTTDV